MHSPTHVTAVRPNVLSAGCTLASAIAAELAKGLPLLPAVTAARGALQEALRASAPLRLGHGVQRPFHHLHMLPPGLMGAVGGGAGVGAGGAGGAEAGGLRRWDREAVWRALRLYAVTDPHCNKKTNRWGREGGLEEGWGWGGGKEYEVLV